MTNPRGDFIWYELMTTDPAAARDFYGAVIGWDIADAGMTIPNGAEYRLIARPDGGHAGGLLTLSEAMCEAGARPLWAGYIHCPEVDASVERLRAAGGHVLMAPTTLPSGRMAMVADPQGAPFYLMDPMPPEGEPEAVSDVFSETEPYRCGWNELACPDPDAAVAFYADLCGWEKVDTMDMGEYGPYHFMMNGPVRLGAIYTAQGGGQGGAPAHWTCYFRVPDIEAADAAIRAHDGTVRQDMHQVPGGDWIVTATDPQGADFAVVGGREQDDG